MGGPFRERADETSSELDPVKLAVLTLSVLTNIGLAYHLLGPSGETRTGSPSRPAPLAVKGEAVGRESQVSDVGARTTPAEPRPISFAELDGMPSHELLNRLRAANLPEELIRAIITAQVDAALASRSDEMRTAVLAATPYWKNLPDSGGLTAAQEEELDRMRHDNAVWIRDLLGPSPPSGLEVITNKARYGELPDDKIELLKAIDSDYNRMTARILAVNTLNLSPEDIEILDHLENEKVKDIRDALSAEEYEDFAFRSSPSATALRSTLRDFAPSEAEFRALFAVQNAFDQQYPAGQRVDRARMRARSEAMPQLMASLRAVLSPERQTDFDAVTKR